MLAQEEADPAFSSLQPMRSGDSDSVLLGWINGRIDSSVEEVTLGDSSANGGLSPQGTEVQTDYMPLLNSLAAYGWQLTCVLPTPILKTNR